MHTNAAWAACSRVTDSNECNTVCARVREVFFMPLPVVMPCQSLLCALLLCSQALQVLDSLVLPGTDQLDVKDQAAVRVSCTCSALQHIERTWRLYLASRFGINVVGCTVRS